MNERTSHACPKCKSINKAIARFCFDCGEPLLRAAEPALPPEVPVVKGPAGPARPKRTGLDRVMMVMLLGSAAFAVLLFARASTRYKAVHAEQAHRIQLDIGKAENKALRDLFAEQWEPTHPQADHEDDYVWIPGDSNDMQTVGRLVQLVRRAKRPEKQRKHDQEFVRQTYRLDKKDAAALARVLSFTDWSVRFTHDGETLRVVAPKDDQKVIESVVTLLDGDDVE